MALNSLPDLISLMAIALLVGLMTVTAYAAETNLVSNPDFVAKGAAAASGWEYPQQFVAVSSVQTDRGTTARLSIPTGVSPTVKQTLTVNPQQDVLASVWVKSDDRFVLRLGPVTASYHTQGQWQKVVALANTSGAKTLDLELHLRSLSGKPATFDVQGLVVQIVTPPAPPKARSRMDRTALVADGQGQAIIVHPDSPTMAELAARVQQAVADRTGVMLSVVTDRQATEATQPILTPSVRDQNLILIGRLGTNRALWPAYGRFLAAADGYYPGDDGYVLRTASNVLRNGKNHIVLGGSTDRGVTRAVDRFIVRLADDLTQQDESWSLPWLLDVELGGECLAAFKEKDALWNADPHDSALPPVEPGYGTVRRWYENAMGYYWSGWDSYRQRAAEYVEPVINDMAYTHHYIAEFMVRTYDMIDDSDLLTDEQRVAFDALIQKNFWEFASGPDRVWLTVFSPPYNAIRMVNRHQIAPWTADLKLAEFLYDYVDLPGDLADVVAFRRSEKRAFMDHMVEHRWGPSAPGATLTEQIEEPVAALARYAIDHEKYVFFDSGNARRSLFLDRIDHRTGLLVRPAGRIDHHLIMGMLATYHQDGRYRTMLEQVPVVVHSQGHFQGRYVNDVHRWTPGPELAIEPVDSLAGVREPAMMPHFENHLHEFQSDHYFLPDIASDDILDFVAFREGFEANDDYVAVSGLHELYLPGAILNFTSRGVYWLGVGQSAIFSPSSNRYFDQNAVHVLRTDRWQSQDVRYPAFAKRNWTANFQDAGGLSMTLEPFMDMRWSRDVLWLQSGLYVVRDQLTALQAGQFDIAVNWRPVGAPDWDGTVLATRSGSSELRVTPLSQQLQIQQNIDAYRSGADEQAYFRLGGATRLNANEHVGAVTVLQARYPGQEAAYTARMIDDATVVLEHDGEKDEKADRIVVRWGGADDVWQTDAKLAAVSETRLQIIDATHFSIDGHTLLASKTPISVSIDLSERVARYDDLDADRLLAELTLPGWRVTDTDDGQHMRALEPSGDNGTLQAALASAVRQLAERASTPRMPDDAELGDQVMAVVDEQNRWQQQWVYEGLLRSTMVKQIQAAGEDIVDLGRVVELDEIRAVHRRGPFKPAELPGEIWVAAPASGGVPAADDAAWVKIDTEPRWQPSVETGNYGRSEPNDQVYQSVKLDGIKARYVRASGAAELAYYDRTQQAARRSMLVQTDDVDGDGEREILVYPRIWPKFIRPRQLEDDAIALLDSHGSERFLRQARTNYQDVQLIDYLGNGRKQVVAVEIDGQIRVVDDQGQVRQSLDLWQMHQTFHRTEGRPNTRHPAGGYTMPYAIGAWRPDRTGRASLVVSRYGALSFIDSAGEFEGVLMPGGYVTPQLLPQGVDFDGDGQDEQLCLARGVIHKIHGSQDARVTDPTGSYFYPQIYHSDAIREPAWDRAIDGAEPILFRTLPWAGVDRAVLVVRENYLGILDAKAGRWLFTWTPLVRLDAATVAQAGRRSLTLVAATSDGLLWQLNFKGRLNDLASFSATRIDGTVRHLAGSPSDDGAVVLSSDRGLYQLGRDGEPLKKIADGRFVSSQMLTDDGAAVVATTDDGRVMRFDRESEASE